MTHTTSSQRVEYTYDADNLRTTKKVYDSQNRLNKTYFYTWADSRLIGYKLNYTFYNPETNAPTSGTMTVRYLYDSDNEAYGININSVDFYYVKDALGNIVALIDAQSGKAALLFDYTSYGIVTRTDPQTDEVSLDGFQLDDFYATMNDIISTMQSIAFRIEMINNCWLDSTLVYKDYTYDSDTGMYYLQSRYYDPEVGRFINCDDTEILKLTQGTLNGANLFAYCNNDPVLNSDPSGKLSINGFAFLLDIAFTAISFLRISKIGYDVIGAGLKYYAKKKGFKLFYDKLLYSAVPKFKGLFSKGFTFLRTAIWRVTGIVMSNLITEILNRAISDISSILLKKQERVNYVWSIVLRLSSLGSAITLVLDYITDGKINNRIVFKGRVIACG